MVLKLYGVDGSQPYRSVKWLLLMKNHPFEEEFIQPGSRKERGSRAQDYLQKNPTGTIPLLEDDGFLLWESHAIMTYLANKHDWKDVYPEDLQKRAKVDQWLHWHHQNTRQFTLSIFAPVVRPDLKIPQNVIDAQLKGLKRSSMLMDKHLEGKTYFVGEKLSLADIALYGEMGQFDKHFLNKFDFTPFENLNAWLQRMKNVPAYEEAHKVMPMIKQLFERNTKSDL